MARTSLDKLAIIDLKKGNKQPFARKVVVVAYYLEKLTSKKHVPRFLFTVIVPKQPEKVTDKWKKAKRFKLPSGFSLIKGTREMIRNGKEQDVPPGFGGYFRKMVSGNLKKKEIDSSIDGLLPAASTALKESEEEAGIQPDNIEVIYNFGVRKIKISGRNLRVNSFAMELKKPKKGKAIDSMGLKYFTLRELKLASKTRTRYNIPLVRPSHVKFVEEVYETLQPQYRLEGKRLSKKATSKKNEIKKIKKRKIYFGSLIKQSSVGDFVAHKHSVKVTRKNIIEKSIRSRNKQKKRLKPDFK